MTHLRSLASGWLAALAALLLCPLAPAQAPSLGQFDPSDVYFQAWLILREAEKDERGENFLEAFKKYDKAKKLFDSVALHHPDWKADLVKDRQASTTETMKVLQPKALEQQNKMAKRTADLVEMPPIAGENSDLAIPQLSPEEQRKVSELQKQILQYRNQLQQARSDRDANAARLRRALQDLEAKRDRMARAPVTGQLRDLEERIDKVERERNAMGVALRASRADHQRALAELATVKADAGVTKKQAEQLQRNLDVQQRAANQVVDGLRRQLKEMEKKLAEKDERHTAVLARAEQLKRQLEEAQAEILDLRDERDSLLQERDQLAALLKLNESDRVRMLIKQNMELGKDLKTSLERLQELHADNNTTKDQLTEAKRDLAVAKGRIIEIQKENKAHKARLADLEERIAKAGQDIDMGVNAGGLTERSSEEMEMLRGIISRQLRIQERRREAREIVMEEVQRLAIEDNAFEVALDIFAQQDLKLTEEESRLLKDFKVDEQFIFQNRPTRQEVANAGEELQQSIAVKEKLARRAFSNERYLAAREVFESILDEHPGHVPTILNLGVVHLRNTNYDLALRCFDDAIVIRGENPFAQYMIGVCHYEMKNYSEARAFLQKAVDQDPSNANAFVFLGSVAGLTEEYTQAQRYFLEAIRLDPTLTEPYFNLAVLRSQAGNKEEALQYYTKALENGAEPDLKFEQSIAR